MRFDRLLIAACACLSLPAMAETIVRVDIRGLDDAMTENVRVGLSLEDALNKRITQRRLLYLLDVAEEETREALEPFGHYNPTIAVQRSGSDDALVVQLDVTPGPPVRVRSEQVTITGPAGEDRYMQREIATFAPKVGDIFVHPVYEAGKARITRRLAERGYFDADFTARRVEVTRAENAADIDLAWDSGRRYDMGKVSFVQEPAIIRTSLLEKLIYWNEGEYYHQGRLDRLRKSLLSLDYFSRISIEPQPQQAVDGLVPVTVTLTPAKRSIYTLGASYGTVSGPGFTAGVERRYLNSRGHKALAQLDYARTRKTLTLQYRVPALRWLDGWYTASLQAADEQTKDLDTRRLEFVASRSGEVTSKLTATASLHVLRERWAYGVAEEQPGDIVTNYQFASFVFPALRADYIDVDDRLFPRRGFGASALLRGGTGRSDAGRSKFAQVHLTGRYFLGIGERNRVLLRAELGHTFSDQLVTLPPSLRFFAGGDRSIRGYGWREVGPRSYSGPNRQPFAIGARNVVTASAEYEHYFNDSWGMAAFVDTGSAFNDQRPELRTGVGVGARWKSPIGPVRIDLARGLNQPDSKFQIYLNIGAEL